MAAGVAFAVAAWTGVYYLYRRSEDSAFPLFWFLPEPLLVVALGIGVWRGSRLWAVVLCAYWFVAKFFMFTKLNSSAGDWIVAIAVFFAYFRGAVSSFDYHELAKHENEKANQSPEPTAASGRGSP